jgi:actin-related protein
MIGTQRFRAPELLFDPKPAGYDLDGIADMIRASINSCDIHLRKDLSQNIILSGGTTLMPGETMNALQGLEWNETYIYNCQLAFLCTILYFTLLFILYRSDLWNVPPGFVERLELELEKATPKLPPVNIIASAHRKYLPWYGLKSIVTDPDFARHWTTAEQYWEEGARPIEEDDGVYE